MKAFFALCLIACASAIAPLREQEYQFLFTKFVAEHNKAYSTSEFFGRYNIFKTNIDYIRAENTKNNSYTLGMNSFGDLTAHEFKTQVVGGCFQGSQVPRVSDVTPITGLRVRAPTPIDWFGQGKVQKVKNQAQCGSCWAFSAIGAVESAWAIAKQLPTVPDLSEQQLVDCAGSEGNMGCNGGLMDYAFQYLIKYGGALPSSAYSYTGRDGTCKAGQAEKSKIAASISSFFDVPENDENALGDALQKGPVSVAVEADQSIFQFYSSGVLDGNCGRNLDHGVLAVGFAQDTSTGYWIVKNSWGANWGNKGFVWIRAMKNMCGIAMVNSYPIV